MASEFSLNSSPAQNSIASYDSGNPDRTFSRLLPREPTSRTNSDAVEGEEEDDHGSEEGSMFRRKKPIVHESLKDILDSDPPAHWSLQHNSNLKDRAYEKSATQGSIMRLTRAFRSKVGSAKYQVKDHWQQEPVPNLDKSAGHLQSAAYSRIRFSPSTLYMRNSPRSQSREGPSSTTSLPSVRESSQERLPTSPWPAGSESMKPSSWLTLETTDGENSPAISKDKVSTALTPQQSENRIRFVPKDAAPTVDSVRELALFFKTSGPVEVATVSSRPRSSSRTLSGQSKSPPVYSLLTSSVTIRDRTRSTTNAPKPQPPVDPNFDNRKLPEQVTHTSRSSQKHNNKRLSFSLKDSHAPSFSMLKLSTSAHRLRTRTLSIDETSNATAPSLSLMSFPNLIDFPEDTKRISLSTAEGWPAELSGSERGTKSLGSTSGGIDKLDDRFDSIDSDEHELDDEDDEDDYQSVTSHTGHSLHRASVIFEQPSDPSLGSETDADADTLLQLPHGTEYIDASSLKTCQLGHSSDTETNCEESEALPPSDSEPLSRSSRSIEPSDVGNSTLTDVPKQTADGDDMLRASLRNLTDSIHQTLRTSSSNKEPTSPLSSEGTKRLESLAWTLGALYDQLGCALTCIVRTLEESDSIDMTEMQRKADMKDSVKVDAAKINAIKSNVLEQQLVGCLLDGA